MSRLFSALYALFPLAALLFMLWQAYGYGKYCKEEGKTLPRSSWAWMLPSVIALVVLVVWGAIGLLEGSFLAIVLPVACIAIMGLGLLSLHRCDVWDWYDDRDERTRKRLSIGLGVLVAVLAVLTIEAPFNMLMPFGGPTYFWLEFLLCGLLLLVLYFLGQRHAVACIPAVCFFFLAGIGQHFIKRFKNAAILPTDLLVLDTAAAVGNEYVFSFNEQTLLGIAVFVAALTSLAMVRPPLKGSTSTFARKLPNTLLGNAGGAAVSLALLVALVLGPNYMHQLGVTIEYWYSITYYQQQGFFPTFIAVLQDMPIRMPDGYTDEEAEALTKKYAKEYREAASADSNHQKAAAQFEEIKPTVIAIMNESFADLSVFENMHCGYEGPQFFKTSFKDALARGPLNVSVHGAGTCNTEFEFLTGNSLGFVGAGKYPYSIYDLSDVDAIAAEFREWGYHTYAMHPNYATNWNRHKVYPQMGFDQFLSIDDFGGTPNVAVDTQTPNEPHYEVFHSGVSDAGTYQRILQLLEEDDAPQLIFDVTMQNHGSYNQNNIPEAYQTHYVPTDFEGDETPERLNEYLACIEKSDDDLREFVRALREIDRPVVLVFFGDHQPTLSAAYNDYWFQNEPEDVHARRAFSTDYVIWANYDVAGREQKSTTDETSVDMLAAQTLDLIGAPVSDFQAAQLAIRKQIPSLSASDYQGDDRTWYVPEDDGSPFAKAYHDLSLIEYLNFARRI